MNYDQQITKLIMDVKADKAIIQPWRNKATARLEEAQAFIRMGKHSSNQMPPEGQRIDANTACTCPIGANATDCPQHGLLAG